MSRVLNGVGPIKANAMRW
nr:hypothetical protein [Paenibacillus solani]